MPTYEPQSVCHAIVKSLEDLKARDLRVLDVVGQATFTDYMVLATGTSSRHVAAIVESVVHHAKVEGIPILGVEGQRTNEWVLVDFVDVVVHVMQKETRAFYDLERLWGTFEQQHVDHVGV